jgi:transposase
VAPGTGQYCGIGRPPTELRVVIEAIFHIMRGGYPWRDLPRRFGPWQTIYSRFRDLCREGVWERLFARLAQRAKGKLRFLDGTYIRVHQDGAPALQLADAEGVGTSRGGRNSKLHAVVDVRGRPVRLVVTPGNTHDITPAPELVAAMPEVIVVADKAYDSTGFRAFVASQNSSTSIPQRAGAKAEAPFHRAHYRKRHRVENFFGRIKRYRRISCRFEKTRASFEGFVLFASILDWIA